MRRTVVKTVLLTLISFLAVVLIAYGCIAASSPKTLANAWGDLGVYGVSVKYYEKQYQKTENISDLAILCDKLNENTDSACAVKYLAILTGQEDFASFCEREDGNLGYGFTAYEFYFGKYACAVFFDKGVTDAVAVAKTAVQKGGYTDNNAFSVLLGVETLTAEDGTAIKTAIESLTGLSPAEQAFANRDIAIANSIR